ncbi:MAG: hypothetical protein ACI381_02810 [Candidatus Methanomethylophilaceae archaeon]
MPKAQTDPATVEAIISLRNAGYSFTYIAEQVGISKSTVHSVLKRADPSNDAEQKSNSKKPARARDKRDSTPQIEQQTERETERQIEQDEPNTESALSALTRERTAKELLSFIAVSKKGYVEAKASKQDPDKKTWQETQYLKLYKDGIKMLIDCTGLSREAIDSLPTSPVDDYLAKALESLKEGQT